VGSSVLMTPSELIMSASEDMHARFGFGKGIVGEIRAILEPVRFRPRPRIEPRLTPRRQPNREQHRL
jgi:hypothetical protein